MCNFQLYNFYIHLHTALKWTISIILHISSLSFRREKKMASLNQSPNGTGLLNQRLSFILIQIFLIVYIFSVSIYLFPLFRGRFQFSETLYMSCEKGPDFTLCFKSPFKVFQVFSVFDAKMLSSLLLLIQDHVKCFLQRCLTFQIFSKIY